MVIIVKIGFLNNGAETVFFLNLQYNFIRKPILIKSCIALLSFKTAAELPLLVIATIRGFIKIGAGAHCH